MKRSRGVREEYARRIYKGMAALRLYDFKEAVRWFELAEQYTLAAKTRKVAQQHRGV